MPKAKKLGKDVIGGKGSGIIQTAKDREEYEEYKRQKLAQDQVEQEEEEKKKVDSEKMPEDKQKEEAEAPFTRLPSIQKGKLKVKKVVLKEEE